MSDLIQILGIEQSLVDETLADAGLPPAIGVHNRCIFRASRDALDLSDGRGWTYHHHVDMACWKRRLYVGWNSCERDEDVWPARELYSTSEDGETWSPPAEMFPQGVSTCLRVYFYLAPAGRMLMIAGLRADTCKTNEETKSALVVREIRADHSLGEIYTLQPPTGTVAHPPMFETSNDSGFIASCRELLDDTVFLEQQDRGRLLGPRRMKWHDAAAWPEGKVPGDSEKWTAGKAYTFFRRPDPNGREAIVGISKMGWTTISRDEGRTWEQPAVPLTLVTGKGKVFAERTADGRFALVYNPSRRNRFPLIIATSDDGVNFRDMRIVHSELPIQRYSGADRSIGPQYARGISRWANDGSRENDRAMWIAYSMSKEDIWVSRIPLPVRVEEAAAAIRGFDDWNFYVPKWASIKRVGDRLRIENRDPYDYAVATRVFRESTRVSIRFELSLQSPRRFEIDLMSKFGSKRPVRLAIDNGTLTAMNGSTLVELARVQPSVPVMIAVAADANTETFSVSVNDQTMIADTAFAEPAESLQRIVFRTGAFRGIGGKNPVTSGSDVPIEPARAEISSFSATTSS